MRRCGLDSTTTTTSTTSPRNMKVHARSSAHVLRAGMFLACLYLLYSVHTVAADSTAFYADNGLQQTVIVKKLPGRERREMQQEILTLLGLHHRPKPKTVGKADSAPKFMIDLYTSLYAEGQLDSLDNEVQFRGHLNVSQFGPIDSRSIDGSDVIMSFVNHDLSSNSRRCRRGSFPTKTKRSSSSSVCRRSAGKVPHLRHERDKAYFFDLSEVSPGETVTGAEVRVYKEAVGEMRHEKLRIELLRMMQGQDPEEKKLASESNTTVYGQDSGWLELNVTRAARLWASFPASNLGLFMRVFDSRGQEVNPKKAGLQGRRGPADKQPFMVSYFKMAADVHIRRTRSVKRRQEQEVTYSDQPYYPASYNPYRHKACQRRTLYVSFRDLGWQDWIIAPDGYSAFYCDGECSFPLGAHMNATNHAIVQTLVHLMDPYLVPKPCCAPTKVSSISVLYFDHQSNVVLKKYKGMIVKACGCH